MVFIKSVIVGLVVGVIVTILLSILTFFPFIGMFSCYIPQILSFILFFLSGFLLAKFNKIQREDYVSVGNNVIVSSFVSITLIMIGLFITNYYVTNSLLYTFTISLIHLIVFGLASVILGCLGGVIYLLMTFPKPDN